MADFPSRRDAAPQQDTAGSPITERNKPEVTWLQLRCEQKFLGDLVFPSSLFINGEADDPSQNKQHASHQALIRDVLRKAFNLKVTGNGCSAPHVKLRCTAWQPTARRGNGPATSRPAPRTVVVTPQTLQDVAECAKESGEGRAYLDVPPRRELPKPAAGCVRLWIHPAERDSQGLERITGIEISLDVLKQQGLALILREVLDREEITPPSPPLMLLPEMVQLTDENFVERCTNSIAQSDQCHVDILLGTGGLRDGTQIESKHNMQPGFTLEYERIKRSFTSNQLPAFFLNGEMIDNALQAFLLRPCNPDVVPMIYFGIVVPGNDPLHAKAAMYHFNTAPGMGIEEDGTDTLLKWAQHGPRDKLKDLSYLETTAPMPLFQDNKLSLFVSGAKNYAFYMGERTEAFSQCANIQMLRSIEIDAEARLKNGDWHSHVKYWPRLNSPGSSSTVEDMMTKYPSYVVGWQKELAGKFPHYSSFVTTKLKKGNVDPLANENGFDNCARVLRGRYAFYMGRQRAWQHSPSPFVPKGMTSQPKIVFEFFDRDVQPDFDWDTLCSRNATHSLILNDPPFEGWPYSEPPALFVESPEEELMRLNLCGTCLPGGAAQGPETGTEDGGTVLHVRVDLNKGLGVLYEHVEGMISFGLTHEGPTEHGSYGRMQAVMMFSPVVEWRKDEHVTSFTRVMQKLAARAGYAESNTNPEEAAENGQEGKARVLVFIKGRGASNVVLKENLPFMKKVFLKPEMRPFKDCIFTFLFIERKDKMNPSGDQFHCDMNFGLKAESSTYEYFPVDWKTKGGRVLFDARNIAERRIIDNMQIYISEMLKQTNKNVFVTSTKSFQKTRLHMHGKQVNACLYSAVTDKEPKKDGAPDPSSRIIRAGDIVKVKLHPAGFKIAHRNVEGQSHQVAYKGRKVVSQFACRVVGLQTGQEIRDVSVPIIHGHLELELYPPCMFPPKLHGKFCLALTSRLDKLQVMGADEIRETFKSLAALLPKKRLDVEVKVCNQWVVLEDAPCQRLSLRGSLPPLRVKLMGSAGSAAPLTHWSAATAYDAKSLKSFSPLVVRVRLKGHGLDENPCELHLEVDPRTGIASMGEDEHKAAAKLAKRVCTYSIDVSIWYESTGYGLSSKQWWKLGLPNPANMGKPQEGRDSLPLGNSLENFLSVVAGDPKLVMADWLDASEVELNSPFVIRVSVWDTPDPERDCDKLRCGKEELAKFQASGSALRTRRLLTPVVVPDRQCHRELVRVSAGEPRWVQHDDGRGEVMEIPVTVGLCQGAAGPQALVDTFAEGGGAPAIVLALSLGSIPLHNSCSRELSLKPGMPKQIHVQGSLQSFVNGTSPGSISVYLCDDKGLPSSLGSNGIVRAGIWYSQDEVATTDVNINGGCTQVEIDLPEIFVRDLPPQGGEVSVTTEAFPLKRSRRNIDTSMVLSSANDLRVKISCSDRLTYLEVWQGGAAEPINKQLVPLTAAAGGEAVASSRCSILAGRQKEFATFYLRILRDGGAVVLVDDLKVWVENIKMTCKEHRDGVYAIQNVDVKDHMPRTGVRSSLRKLSIHIGGGSRISAQLQVSIISWKLRMEAPKGDQPCVAVDDPLAMLSIVAVDDACESCWPLALAQQVLDPPDPIALSVAEGRDVKFHVGDENLDELRALEHLDGSSTEALSFSSVRLVAQGLRAVQVGIDGGSAGAAELHLVPGAPHSLQIQPPKGTFYSKLLLRSIRFSLCDKHNNVWSAKDSRHPLTGATKLIVRLSTGDEDFQMVMATQELKACELKVDEGDGTKIVVPEIKADLDKFAGRVKLSLALELGNAGEIAGLVDLDIVEHAGFLHDVDWIGNTGGERLVVAGGQLPEIRFKFILGSNKPATGEVLQALLDATTAAFTPKVKAEMARGRLADQRAVLEAVGAPSAGEVALKCEEPVTTAGAFQVCLRFKETRPEITSYWPASERAFIMPSAIRIQAAAASELALDLPETTQFNARNGRGNTVEPACIPLVIRDPFKNISASADGVLIRATIEMEREGEGNSRAEPPRLERSSGTICRVREGRVAFQDLSVVEGSGARDDGRRLGCVLRFTAECADGMDIRPLEVPLSFVDVAGPGKKLQDLQKACNAANHHLRAASREASAANSIAQELGEQLQPLHGKARLSMLRLAKELDSARIPLPKGFLDFSTTTPDLSTPGGVELLAESVELVAEEVEPGTGFSRMRHQPPPSANGGLLGAIRERLATQRTKSIWMVRPSTLFSPQRNSLLQEQIDSRPEGVYGTVCSLLVVDGRDPLARAWAPLLFKLKQADMSSVVVAESASKAAALQQLGPDVSFIQLDRLEHHRPPGGGRLPELPRDPSGGNPRYAEGVVCLRPDLSEAARQAVGHLPREIFGNMVLMDSYEAADPYKSKHMRTVKGMIVTPTRTLMGSRDRPVPQVQPGRDPTMGVLDTDRMKVLEALERCQAIVENQVVPHLQGLRHPVSGYLAALTQSQWAVEAMEAARAKKLQADAEHERERINHDRRDVSSLSSSVTPLATPSPSGRQSARQQATPVSASAPGSSSSSPLTGHRTPSPVDDQGPPRQRARHS